MSTTSSVTAALATTAMMIVRLPFENGVPETRALLVLRLPSTVSPGRDCRRKTRTPRLERDKNGYSPPERLMANMLAHPNILIVEDDPRVARLVERSLVEDGYLVDVSHDGPQGETKAKQLTPDAIVLDLMLPGQDGLAMCRRLRDQGVRTPVLMLTARDAVPDRVRGLDAGADDYLTKPFALDELLARIRALLRRPGASGDSSKFLHVGDLKLNLDSHEAFRSGMAIELTDKEFRLLAYLMRHAGRVLTRAQIVDQVWGYDTSTTSNVVETYICYVRDKVDRGFARPLIRTVRGAGYMLKP